jgi:SAM-dependent methyltransferase
VGFEAEWLAARAPYDDAALDPVAVDLIRRWGTRLRPESRPVVVDLGSGTGEALRRVRRWLAPREIVAYAVDRDPELLVHASASGQHHRVMTITGDLLEPLAARGGPLDGSVDLVVGHAIADLLPLNRLAARVAALARPGGLVHLALAYDGLTTFSPALDPALDETIVAAFHRHMDRPAIDAADYGGSLAGRRLAQALSAAGLDVLRDAPSTWVVSARDDPGGRWVLFRLIRFVVDAVLEVGGVSPTELARWEASRHDAIASGKLSVRVEHRDVLAQAPLRGDARSTGPV